MDTVLLLPDAATTIARVFRSRKSIGDIIEGYFSNVSARRLSQS